jgi:glycosyltransferase involved in cell wall biosynthesis
LEQGVKVAVVGNMNNNMFALTRHLRDRHLDAELLFAPGYDHFHPKADTFELEDLAFCHEVSWLDNGFYSADPAEIRRDLRGYDVVFATGAEAAALSLARVPIDIYFPYGDDVFTYAQLPEQFSVRQIAREELKFFLKRGELTLSRMRNGTQFGHVRRAICSARYVLDDMANDDYNSLLLSLPLHGTVYRSPWPMVYPAPYRDGWDRADVHWRSVFDRIRSEHELILLYHGRHEWTRDDIHRKNTHHLLLGFAEFVRQHPDVTPCLVTVEYGRDVGASKAMIADLGLADRVIWFPRMYRKDLMYLIDVAHICAGQFDRSFLTFGTILEALSVGKPVIHHRDDAVYRDIPLFPVLNAREPPEIAAALTAFIEDPDTWRRSGLEGRAWFDEHVARRPLDFICQLLGRGDGNRRESPSHEPHAHVG